MKGIIIVEPHGTYIANGTKKIIIKSKKFDIIDKPLLLIQKKEALGVIYIDSIKEINLTKFNKDKKLHLVTDQERKKWWKDKKVLYEYHISKRNIFVAPVPIAYKQGPQVFININNIKPLQKIYIGTSGYSYDWWKDFYQHKSKTEDKLKIYSDNFQSLEINGSFYKEYKKSVWTKLKDIVPQNFTYSVKVNQSITHYYQFQKYNKFWNSVKVLIPKLKCVLFQFPEHFKYSEKNMERLRNLDTNIRAAFEFRDKLWFNSDVYELFKRKRKWSIVVDYHGFKWSNKSNLSIGFNPQLDQWPITSDFIYFRLHGTTGKYEGSHRKILPKVAKFIRNQYNEGIKYAFVYFNNTDSLANNNVSNAIVDAKYLQKIIGI